MRAKQTEMILHHLQTHPEGITQLEALLQYGVGRLSARIWDLRHAGYPIGTTFETKGEKTYGRYYLHEVEKGA